MKCGEQRNGCGFLVWSGEWEVLTCWCWFAGPWGARMVTDWRGELQHN